MQVFYSTNPTGLCSYLAGFRKPGQVECDFDLLYSQWISDETLCARVRTVKDGGFKASKTVLNWTALLTAWETMPTK